MKNTSFHVSIRVTRVELDRQITLAKEDDNLSAADLAKLENDKRAERVSVVGSAQEWNDYRAQFELTMAQAIEDGTISSREALVSFAKVDGSQ